MRLTPQPWGVDVPVERRLPIPYRSWKTVIAVIVGGVTRKVLQVQFEPGGGFYVHLPYFRYTQGVLGRYALHAAPGEAGQIRLTDGGMTTTKRVKYTHHVDGEAHFSQDGKVKRLVRMKSAPLGQSVGHLITAQLRGYDLFAHMTTKDEKPATQQRRVLRFDLGEEPVAPTKLTLWWYHASSLAPFQSPLSHSMKADAIALETGDGERFVGLLLAPPLGDTAEDFRLVVGCKLMPELQSEGPFLLLTGGFGESDDGSDRAGPLNFLALRYAETADFDELERMLGSIDIQVL